MLAGNGGRKRKWKLLFRIEGSGSQVGKERCTRSWKLLRAQALYRGHTSDPLLHSLLASSRSHGTLRAIYEEC